MTIKLWVLYKNRTKLAAYIVLSLSIKQTHCSMIYVIRIREHTLARLQPGLKILM